MSTVSKGDLIQVRRGGHLLVVEAGEERSEDTLRGDSYSCFQMKTISVNEINKVNPKVKTWTFEGGSMGGPNMVEAKDVRVIGRGLKVHKYTEVRYAVDLTSKTDNISKTELALNK